MAYDMARQFSVSCLGLHALLRRNEAAANHLIGTREATAAKTSRAGIEKRMIRRIRVNMAASTNLMLAIYQP
jgi:hypothetical protein